METFLTKAMTIVALICFLLVGVAATAIVGRDSIPTPRLELASASVSAVQGPVSNREGKQDKLAVAGYSLQQSEPQQLDPVLNESLRRAYASTSPADLGMPKEIAAPSDPTATQAIAPAAPTKPKVVAKPAPQKSYALLSDIQIAGIKERLKLSAAQEILLAAGGDRVARRRPQDPCGPPGQSERARRADRSGRGGSPAAEVGRDAAAVPVA